MLLRSFTISEDFRNMDTTIEVHLTSIDLLLSVKVDSRNRINSVSTIYTPAKPKTKKVSISNTYDDSERYDPIIVDKMSLAFRRKYHILKFIQVYFIQVY